MLQKIIRFPFIMLIRFYQLVISPIKPASSCKFYPTCSQYMLEAIQIHGVIKGFILGFRRLGQCRPGSHYCGYDPVPEKGQWHSTHDARCRDVHELEKELENKLQKK